MRNQCALTAKVARPVLPRVIQRERLFRVMDAACGNRLLWVSGPAGSGKTTLAASYLEARNLPALWYNVDPGDRDPATFFHYFRLAAKHASPRSRKPIPRFQLAYLQKIEAFARRFFEAVFARLPAPSHLVLNDVHHLAASDSPILSLILENAVLAPEHLGFILAGRKEPPQEAARLRLNRQLPVIGWDDLRFTLEETLEFLHLYLEAEQAREAAASYHAAAQGWAAGLVLFVQKHPADRAHASHLPSHRSSPEILNYFACELFDGLEPNRRDFLMKTVWLPSMTAAMAEKLSGMNQAKEILEELMAQNCLLEASPDVQPWYRFHDLFRNFLQARAREHFPEDAIRNLKIRAAGLLEAAGEMEAAADLYREAAQWESLAGLILREAPKLAEHYRNQILIEWLGALPVDALGADPWLQYWLGTALLPFQPHAALEILEGVFHRFRRAGDARGAFLTWANLMDVLTIFHRTHADHLPHWLEELKRVMARHPRFPGNRSPGGDQRAHGHGLLVARPRGSAPLAKPRRSTPQEENGTDAAGHARKHPDLPLRLERRNGKNREHSPHVGTASTAAD